MISGSSKGLGAAFAKELAGRGMNLVLVARSIDTLQDLADSLGAQYGVRCVVLQADLATSGAVKRNVTELGRLDLKIDLLINSQTSPPARSLPAPGGTGILIETLRFPKCGETHDVLLC